MKSITKRGLSIFLAITIIFSFVYVGLIEINFRNFLVVKANAVCNGTIGDNLTWVLDDNGTLTVSGTGGMEDYHAFAPWSSFVSKIKKVVIMPGVTNIGDYDFEDCNNLTTVEIGTSVSSIGYSAFTRCTSLEKVIWNAEYISDFASETSSPFYCAGTDGAGIEFIFGDTVKNIPAYLFYVSSYNWQERPYVTSVSFGKNITRVGECAFYNCSYINSVYITDIMSWCNIDFVSYDSNPLYFSDSLYLNGELVKEIEIPEGTTNIGRHAFYCYSNLSSIIIPDSITSIGSNAFYKTGYYKDESNWENDILYIGNYLIDARTSINDCTIKDGTKTIASSAFENCSALESITIPNSVISIGDNAFIFCTKLSSIEIPDSVTSIGASAFHFTGLNSVTLSKNVKKIGERAFGYTDYDEKNEAFKIYGVKDTVAETYANDNGFKFIEIKKPAQPTLKKVSNVDGNVKVIWGKVSGADTYRVYRKVSTGSYEYIGSTTSTSYTDKKAPAGKTCKYRIRAKNEIGYSEYSASLAIKHIDEPTLKSIENSAYGILIKWNKVTGAEKYNVYRKVSGGEYKYIGATSNAYYTDKTAESGKKYYYAIRGKRDDSVSSQSASLSKYYLADPTLSTPTSTSKGIGLRWSEVTGAEGYKVYRKTADGSYKLLTTEKGVSNVTFRDTTAKKGTKYYYKVKAYKSKTYSAYSNAKAITDKY